MLFKRFLFTFFSRTFNLELFCKHVYITQNRLKVCYNRFFKIRIETVLSVNLIFLSGLTTTCMGRRPLAY